MTGAVARARTPATAALREIQSPRTSRICSGRSHARPRSAACSARASPVSSSACAASDVSHTGDRHGWQYASSSLMTSSFSIDRRAIALSTTAQGKEIVGALYADVAARMPAIADALPADEQHQLAGAIARITAPTRRAEDHKPINTQA